jgi:plasmid maintenance system antidote protein VapI/Zn-dependent peptidase ImmA (M78 family)
MTSERQFQPDWVSAPGETIADVLRERQMSPVAFAQQIGSSEEEVNELLHGRSLVTDDVALLLERYLGGSRIFWLNRESQYREDLLRLGRDAQSDQEWLKELPLKDMVRFEWLRDQAEESEMVDACLRFFGVPDKSTWQEVYGRPLELAAFRTSSSFDSHPAAVAAWLRQGELEARAVACETWDPQRFRDVLLAVRPLTRQKDPARFIPQLIAHCADAGVAVVVLRAPTGCRASGATRFLSPQQGLLLLSFRYLSDDHFWFTFFHEAAHLLLHGRSALFLETADPLNSVYEREANEFAAQILIPDRFRSELNQLTLTANNIIRYAIRIGISPGIVVGQLQHTRRLRHDQMNRLKRRFRWE